MADDEEPNAEPGGEEKKAKGASERARPHLVLRLFLGLAGLLLVVGFFLPWFQLGDGDIAGLQLVTSHDPMIVALVGQDAQRWILLLIPGFGVALIGVAVAGLRYSGPVAAILGVLIVGYGMVTVVIFFFQKTGLGLWLILLGAFLAVAAGALSFVRGRASRPARAGEPPDPG